MKNRLEDLIQKASVASPPEVMSKSGWVPYLPILRILMEERGYTLMAAVHWLVQQGEIPASRQNAAYRGLSQILARREAKKVRQQIRLQQQLRGAVNGEGGGTAEAAGSLESATACPLSIPA